MKNISSFTAFCLMLLTSTVSSAQKPSNVEGHWNMEVESPMGSGSPIFDLKQSPDASITGTYQGRLGEANVKGKIKGNIIHLEFSISGNLIEYDGKVEGDTMKGKVKFADQGEGTFVGARKKG